MRRLRNYSLSLAILILAGFTVAQSQAYYGAPKRSIEITPFAGYMVNTDIVGAYGYVENDDAVSYGGAIAFDVQRMMQIEVSYTYSKATSYFRSASIAYDSFDFDVAYNHIVLASVHELKPGGKVIPYGKAGLGAWWASPEAKSSNTNYQLEDTWRMMVELALGAKIYMSEKVGIRLEANVGMPLNFYGAGFYVGTGGSGMAANAGIPMAHFNFTGGLVIVI
jgi:hypothetical protein